jgi:hypothetical protein
VVLVMLGAAVGCRTDVGVAVAVRPDGSGTVTVTVTLDREAAAQLGDPASVSVADLRLAGWRVDDPVRAADGGLRFRAVRPFGSPAQLEKVLTEVGGSDGVFRKVDLSIDDGLAATSYRFRGGLELSGDPAQFSDPELTKVLGGLPLGRTPEELRALGADRAAAGRLTVSVDLPGGSPDTNGTVRAGRAVWAYPLTGGRATSTVLRSEASATDGRTVTLVVVGVGLLLVAVVLVVVGLVRTRRRPTG